MIYREQSNEINNGTCPSTDVLLTRAAKVLFHDAPDIRYPILLINMVSHVATAVNHEVSWRGGSKLAKRQQHAVIEIIINALN